MSSTPLYGCAKIHLSIYLLMNIWAVDGRAIANKSAMNVYAQVFLYTCIFISLW